MILKHFLLEYDTCGSIHIDFISKITASGLLQQTNICPKLTTGMVDQCTECANPFQVNVPLLCPLQISET